MRHILHQTNPLRHLLTQVRRQPCVNIRQKVTIYTVRTLIYEF